MQKSAPKRFINASGHCIFYLDIQLYFSSTKAQSSVVISYLFPQYGQVLFFVASKLAPQS